MAKSENLVPVHLREVCNALIIAELLNTFISLIVKDQWHVVRDWERSKTYFLMIVRCNKSPVKDISTT